MVVDYPEEVASPALWRIDLLLELCGQSKSLCIDPALLVLCDKQTS